MTIKNIAGIAALSLGLMAGSGLALATSTASNAPAASSADGMTDIDRASFVKAVSSANLFEIETSTLALEKSTSDRVKDAARMIIKDHTSAGKAFSVILKAQGDMTRPKLSPHHEAVLNELKATKRAGFDARYIEVQTTAHEEAIALFTTYAAKPDDVALGAFATKTLPALKTHLEAVKRLQK